MRHLYLCVDGGIGGLAVICYKQLAFILLRNSKFVTAGQYLYACLLQLFINSESIFGKVLIIYPSLKFYVNF